jgi:mono/diheme cytochrome c family protein
VPDGKPFAGGYPVETPFGKIYGTNITPDPETGIGRWSEAAFRRSMREGVDQAGHHLYPAFPYDHFTKLTDEDIHALYAFVMTRTPVRAETPENELPFPYSFRPLLAGWKLLFLKQGVFQPDPTKDAAWNRGAYLAEALSQCGDCHTPRNRLGAEEASRHFDGGEVNGWWAPPLNRTSPAPVPWTEDSLFAYLRSWDAQHGGAAGPMARVTAELGRAPEADVRAMATYVASLMGPPSADRLKRTDAVVAGSQIKASGDQDLASGAAIYAGLCASCHESAGQVPFTVHSLAQHTAVAAPDPRNVIHVVQLGIHPPEGEVGGIMPGFADTLTEKQTVDLLKYVRARFSDQPPWADLDDQVRRTRRDDGAS